MNIDYSKLITKEQKQTESLAVATSRINAWRDVQEQDGVKFDFDGHRFDGNDRSLSRLQGAIEGGLGSQPGFFWTDDNNNDIQLTGEQLSGLLSAMQTARAIRGFQIHQRQRQMKEEIAVLDAAGLAQYQYGWPPEPTDPDQPA